MSGGGGGGGGGASGMEMANQIVGWVDTSNDNFYQAANAYVQGKQARREWKERTRQWEIENARQARIDNLKWLLMMQQYRQGVDDTDWQKRFREALGGSAQNSPQQFGPMAAPAQQTPPPAAAGM